MKRTPGYRFLFYLFVSISVFLIIIKPQRFVNSVRSIFSYIFNPMFFFKPQDAINGIYERIHSMIVCSMEMQKILDENLKLKSRMIFMDLLINENKKLSEIIALKKGISFKGTFSRIISLNAYNPYISGFIDKGKNDGVELYNPVLALINERWFLVGRVSEVHDDFSKISFITAPGFSFIVDTPSSRGLLISDGKKLVYKFIEGDLKVGDNVYSSKISTTFPPFLYVGIVKEIKESADFRVAYVESFKINDVDIVYVVDFKPYIESLEEDI